MIDISQYELKIWPMPPRKICSSDFDMLLGRISPSLLMRYLCNEEVIRYIVNTQRYQLYKRELTKCEYKSLVRAIKDGKVKL